MLILQILQSLCYLYRLVFIIQEAAVYLLTLPSCNPLYAGLGDRTRNLYPINWRPLYTEVLRVFESANEYILIKWRGRYM